MRLKKALSICSVFAIAASMTAGMQLSASAATQVYTMPDISSINQGSDTSDLDENGYNGVTTILNGAETGPWSGVKTGKDSKWRILKQNIKDTEGDPDGDGRFASAAGAAFKFDYSKLNNSGITNNDIIYYTFNFMGAAKSGNGGNYAINGQRFDSNGISLFDSVDHMIYQHHPERMTVIVDNLNEKTYYYSTTNSVSKATVTGYETAIMLGTRSENTDATRTFFNDFSSGKIEYAVSGDDTVTAGGNATYSITETGSATYYYTFTPENVTYTLASAVEGVTIINTNGTLNVADTVADNTTVTINANINGTKVASKTVTVSAPAASEPSVTVEKLTESNLVNGNDGSVADVFYGTYTSNGDTTVNTIKITVNGKTESLSTTNLSGAGDVSFGVVISYADGDNKGYTPTFTFE